MSDEDGISVAARKSALARLLEEPTTAVLRHFRGRRATRSLCGGVDGYTTDSAYAVTCESCKAAHVRRAARRKAA